MDFLTIAKLRKYLSIKHHIPGRIRIIFDKSIIEDPNALSLMKEAPEMPDAVKNTSLNVFSKSVVIEYDTQRVAPESLEKIINASSDEAAKAAVKQLHAVLYS